MTETPPSSNGNSKSTHHREWVVQWKQEPEPAFLDSVSILHKTREDTEGRLTMLIRLKKQVEEDRWLDRWSAHEGVEFIHPNHKYKVEKREVASSPTAKDRYYLDSIHARQAWTSVSLGSGRARPVTVAVVDTGIDLEHPALKPFLTRGINLRVPSSPPTDEMGHGTHVAGVMAEVWKGWFTGKRDSESVRPRIMPVKVMTDGQDGDVYFTAEGIREAVRNGADVIVLSQGSWTYSETIADATRLAEEKGAVVVGAAGNARLNVRGDVVYNRPLYYPAALPTVLGVGSVDEQNKVVITSNSGPGMDVAAPGESIWAALPQGKYGADSGTSFAVPQVAALAALLMDKEPKWTPAQVRQQIRQSARPLKNERWNEQYGFGLIDLHKALVQKPKKDIFEPNERLSQGMPMSVDQVYEAVLSGYKDRDCYRIEPPYTGTVQLSVKGKADDIKAIKMEVKTGKKSALYSGKELESVQLTVSEKKVSLCLSSLKKGRKDKFYTLSNEFSPNPDEYENNDYPWSAHKLELSPGYTSILGTFHKKRDDDWFRMEVPEPGELHLKVNIWSPRGDPVLYVQERGGWKGKKVDERAEGESEEYQMKVKSGSLYVRVSDYGTNPIPDPYNLFIDYKPESQDDYKPNNTSDQAILLVKGDEVTGRISGPGDLDWYTFGKDYGNIQLDVYTSEKNHHLKMILYDEKMRVLDQLKLSGSHGQFKLDSTLPKGSYLLRLEDRKSEKEVDYRLRFSGK
ncbi:S8 family serine peptidase [Kroppenstedtia pulmonis]|uniref:S8 family serine peptidase n=1 Tax=Kroppenstedtia pulmonis TaxID=1380685 RepID=A0A7D4CHW1_9BACL|nr:S8 family serine peptidase [Kroppenstedtia pulmonis]QKG85674.1 S8 family serine peptidase [Kroppenstedtia pulmonis]